MLETKPYDLTTCGNMKSASIDMAAAKPSPAGKATILPVEALRESAVTEKLARSTGSKNDGRDDPEIWKLVCDSSEYVRFYSHNGIMRMNLKNPFDGDTRPTIQVLVSTCTTDVSYICYTHKTSIGTATIYVSRQRDLLFFAKFEATNGRIFTSKTYNHNDIDNFGPGWDSRDSSRIVAEGSSFRGFANDKHLDVAKECLGLIPIVILRDDGSVRLEFPHESHDTWMRVRADCVLGAAIPELPAMTPEKTYDHEKNRILYERRKIQMARDSEKCHYYESEYELGDYH